MLYAKRLAVVLILTFAFTVSFCSASSVSSEPNAADLVRAVRESENWIHKIDSLYIRIESKWTRTPEGIAAIRAELKEQCLEPATEPNRLTEPKSDSNGLLEYAFDEGRVRFLSQESGCGRRLKIWDGKQLVAHEMYFSDNQEHYYLSWTPQGSFHELIAFQTSWLRAQPHSFWWDRKDVDELLSYYGCPEDFVFTKRSNYRGVDCFVMEFYPRDVRGILIGQSHRCDYGMEDHLRYGLIGEALGLADQSYRWYVGIKDNRLYGLTWLVSKKPHVEHWMSDYRQVSPGCWFPMIQGYELYGRDDDDQPFLEARRDLKVLKVRVNERLPNALFHINLRQDVKVIDNRSGRSVTYMYEPEPPDLTGKALPDFNNINVELAKEQAWDRMVLMCFWDMEQRPSRNCIRQLSKRAQELKAKDIVVVAVQATKVDEDTLNEWIKKNNISFPVGIVQGDDEKARFNWGVKSLPWLILTDKEHIVRAEGFALSELDAKIEEIVPSANDAVNTSKVTGAVKDPQGQVLSSVRVTEFQMDKEYTTDSGGKFVSAYGPSDERRFFFAVHKQRKLVGVGLLPAAESNLEIELLAAKMVSGKVVDSDGKPVTGAQVAPLPMTCFYVLTDNQGEFDVGWNPEWAGDLKEFYLMARHLERNLAGGTEINEDTKTVQIKLVPALKLTGTVEDPNGVPIPGAKVGLSLRRGWACGTPVKGVVTDDQGRYEFPTLPQMQEYINYANAEGYWQNGIKTGIINNITDREEVGPIILKKPNMSVSGVVVDSTSKTVANCRVGVRGEGQPQRTTETNAQGKFTLEKICSGPIEIWGKLGSVLYGTVQAQAGQKDVKLVVLTIR